MATRQVDEIAPVEILAPDGTTETLEGTPIHPIWSIDRQDWIPLGELIEGEQLQAASGVAVVLSLTLLRSSLPVYNIEVHGERVYQVGELGLLVHNIYVGTRNVRLSDLRPHPQRPFADADKLADHGAFDMAKYSPIEVEIIDGAYVIMSGMTRFENALKSGITHLPVKIFKYE